MNSQLFKTAFIVGAAMVSVQAFAGVFVPNQSQENVTTSRIRLTKSADLIEIPSASYTHEIQKNIVKADQVQAAEKEILENEEALQSEELRKLIVKLLNDELKGLK